MTDPNPSGKTADGRETTAYTSNGAGGLSLEAPGRGGALRLNDIPVYG